MSRKLLLRQRCAYKGCTVEGRRRGDGHLFRFPSDDKRRSVWMTNCANPRLYKLTKKTVLHYGLCKQHFPNSAFTNTDQEALNWNAVPHPYVEEPPSPMEVVTKEDSSNRNEPTQCSLSEAEPQLQTTVSNDQSKSSMTQSLPFNPLYSKLLDENDDLKNDITRLKIANKKLRGENDKLFTKSEERSSKIRSLQYHLKQTSKITARAVANVTIDDILRNHDPPLHHTAETMVRLQFHKTNTPYNQEEQELTKQIQYHAPSAYSRMRRAGCVLPGASTVRSWVSQYEIIPGFCQGMFEQLKQKMSILDPLDRYCSLAWDEMPIKSTEEYSSKLDLIEGLVDLGPLGRRYERAENAFFFNLTSLNSTEKWRQPIAYFLSGNGGMTPEDIHLLLQDCLQRLEEADVKVKLLVSNPNPQNQHLYENILEINYDEATVNINEKVYFIAFDFPNLIKQVVVALREYGTIWQNNRIIASWSDFAATHTFDKKFAASSLLGHISDLQFSLNSLQGIPAKRTFQILGNRYAQAINSWGSSLQSSSESNGASSTWEETAEFAEKMNDIIDACYSTDLLDKNPNRMPLSPDNPHIEEQILDLIEWSCTWQIANKSGYTALPCFQGLNLTGKAFLNVYKNLSQKWSEFKFFTSRGNLDGTEHWFSLIRARNGISQNLTAKMVRISTRHILSMGYARSAHSKTVSCDDNDFLVASKPSRISLVFDNPAIPMRVPSEINLEESSMESEMLEVLDIIREIEQQDNNHSLVNSQEKGPTSLDGTNAMAFLARYAAFRGVSKCQTCKKDMCKSISDDSSIENIDVDRTNVNKATRPDWFAKLIELQLQAFDQIWRKHWGSASIHRNITANLKGALQLSTPDWFIENLNCYSHRLTALKFLVKVKILSRMRLNNQEALREQIKCYNHNKRVQKKVTRQ
ncbi:uncharacterized protein LOC135161020 [Diachasmimorpha longicaudata]|uniref:uncharacterized protein LOC135161020 n=1 Tax=Diachasmimorpha longicaudata TaxID=58733 RepID=UPI0030B8F35D